jgi:murein DD-endopeptidase MepM/ murein hydrolase activator NlpD
MLAGLLLCVACAGQAPAVQPKCPSVETRPENATSASTPAPSTSGVDQVEAELIRRINAVEVKGIMALYGASMAKAYPEEETGPFYARLADKYGRIVSSERLPGSEGDRTGLYHLKAERGEMKLELHVDGDGKVIGLLFEPARPVPSAVARSSISLALPVRGQWSVFWGGDRKEVNTHVTNVDQRRAADLDLLGPDGKDHHGEGKSNEDFYAYGQDVLAVADGTVVTVIDGVPDNTPGSMNRYVVPGNCVTIQHTDSLYSVYAHLRPGKSRVKVGMKVKQGAVVGSVGNSGNSSQPHLHFQLQDGPLAEKALGVEGVFKDVALVRDGKSSKVAEYTFLKGDLVGEPQPAAKKNAPLK